MPVNLGHHPQADLDLDVVVDEHMLLDKRQACHYSGSGVLSTSTTTSKSRSKSRFTQGQWLKLTPMPRRGA